LIKKAMEKVIGGLNYLRKLSSIVKSGIASPPGGLLARGKANDRC